MTREEREDAIDIIQSILDKYEEDECLATEITIGDEDIKAFKMAIKALEQEPCDDCISRFEVTEIINSEYDIDKMLDRVDELPSVASIRPKGHWEIKDSMWWVCSACGCQTHMMKKYNVPNFCPACGAKMVEPQESEASDA
jgi:rubrerythrin